MDKLQLPACIMVEDPSEEVLVQMEKTLSTVTID